jgi:hypothetical protein
VAKLGDLGQCNHAKVEGYHRLKKAVPQDRPFYWRREFFVYGRLPRAANSRSSWMPDKAWRADGIAVCPARLLNKAPLIERDKDANQNALATKLLPS